MTAIVLENLKYEVTGKQVLKGIDLEVETGQVISIMGQSGSGKTTLLKLMTGLLRPTSGKIIIDGTDIAELSERELDKVRLRIGLVFQYAALFDSLSVYDNILFGLRRHGKKMNRKTRHELVAKHLAEVELDGIEKLLPSQLSGGMQKRVGLARALALEPSIIFYDEPTSGLDPVTAHTIDELILSTRRRRGVTSVVVSHHLPSILRISDRVAMLNKGEFVLVGTPEEIQQSTIPVVREFLHPEMHSVRPPAGQ